MTRLASLIAVFTLFACQHGGSPPSESAPAASAGAKAAELVLPGPFAEQTTLADLQARFGKSNVKITDVEGYDGPVRGVVLFPDDPTRRASVRFYDPETLEHLASVTVTEPSSLWRGKLGIKIGTSFAELQALNVEKFFYGGFDAEHNGHVRDWWNAGALDVQEEDSLYFGVDLRLREPVAKIPKTAYPHDEPMTASDDPRFPKLGELAEVSGLTAWSSLDDEWSGDRAPIRPRAHIVARSR